MQTDLGPTAHYPSEAAKHLALILPHIAGNIIDLGSGGWPVVENAIQVELSSAEFNHYTGGRKPAMPIQWHGNALDLPFKDGVVGTVFSSNLLEDFPYNQWPSILLEWSRVLGKGGKLIILTPDRKRWNEAIARGQTPNCAHHHEPNFGEVSAVGKQIGLTLIEERYCNDTDYNVITILQR